MLNRKLTPEELAGNNVLLNEIRARLEHLAGGDPELLFARRRKLWKELLYDERGKPGHRRALKAKKRAEQGAKCAHCGEPLAAAYNVLDRINGMGGYTVENTRLLCGKCDKAIQLERAYRG